MTILYDKSIIQYKCKPKELRNLPADRRRTVGVPGNAPLGPEVPAGKRSFHKLFFLSYKRARIIYACFFLHNILL